MSTGIAIIMRAFNEQPHAARAIAALAAQALRGFTLDCNHPDDPDSSASLLTNRELPGGVSEIRHMCRLMLRELGWENDPGAQPLRRPNPA